MPRCIRASGFSVPVEAGKKKIKTKNNAKVLADRSDGIPLSTVGSLAFVECLLLRMSVLCRFRGVRVLDFGLEAYYVQDRDKVQSI